MMFGTIAWTNDRVRDRVRGVDERDGVHRGD